MASRTENQIILDSMPIIYSAVKQLNCAGPGYDDAVQIGRIAALKAARRYKPEEGTLLSTWIYLKVFGAIKDWMDSETLRRAGHGYRASDGGNDASDWAPRQSSDLRNEPEAESDPYHEMEGNRLSAAVQAKIATLPADLKDLAESMLSGELQKDYAQRVGINASTHHRRRLRLAEFSREIKDELDE